MTMSVEAITGSTTTQSCREAAAQIRGIALVAVRLGQALQAWGERIAQPPTQEQLQRRRAIEREADLAFAAQQDLRNRIYRLG